ncbi:uncharacterized protein At2g27730, mitochondrial-like [Andrographis paniculata]|uniref:uncharacterized protein At2g27730, mitochondrial-like n=1 Tax=Andrographis paniculata TaxID=175694 RepID=UPI0021E6E4EE|nr:uncharacterized protein At2g27730, mitochondrial-like [Andrographis paniculata]
MAMRMAISRYGAFRSMESYWRSSGSSVRCLSDGKGRVLSEEERAQEAVYIKKMEKEKMEKLKKAGELEKPEKEKTDKVGEDQKR